MHISGETRGHKSVCLPPPLQIRCAVVRVVFSGESDKCVPPDEMDRLDGGATT